MKMGLEKVGKFGDPRSQNTDTYDEPKRHIVLSGKRNIVGVDDKTDMSENYEKFDEMLHSQ